MELKNFVAALVGATAGFLVGAFGSAYVLSSFLVHRGASTDLSWIWLPWIVAPIAGSIAGVLIFRCTESTRAWHWLVLGAPVPVGFCIIALAFFTTREVTTSLLIRDSFVQLAISLTITFAVGMSRMRRHGAAAVPVLVDAPR